MDIVHVGWWRDERVCGCNFTELVSCREKMMSEEG